MLVLDSTVHADTDRDLERNCLLPLQVLSKVRIYAYQMKYTPQRFADNEFCKVTQSEKFEKCSGGKFGQKFILKIFIETSSTDSADKLQSTK